MAKKYLKAQVKVNKGEKTFRVLASNGAVDRMGEVIDPKGWDLTNFLANPVILWAHDYSQLPIGVATETSVQEEGLVLEGRFADKEANPQAEQVRLLYEDGILNAVSVGFIPKERNGNVITKSELLEVSFVPVPANPEALALAISKGYDPKMFETKADDFTDVCKEESDNYDEELCSQMKNICDPNSGDYDKDKCDEMKKKKVDTKPAICEPDSPSYDPEACGAIFCNPQSPDYNQDFCDLMKSKSDTAKCEKCGQNIDTSLSAKNGEQLPSEAGEKERSASVAMVEIPVETLKELLSNTRQADKHNELANACLKRILNSAQ